MKRLYLIFWIFLLGLGACAPAAMRLDPSLAYPNKAMPVSGKQGWQIGQVIHFGDFRTSEINRSWTFGYDLPFLLRFQGAREKLGFQQFDASGQFAGVYLVNTLTVTELPLLNDFFRLSIVDETALTGSIVTDSAIWTLLVYAPNTDLRNRHDEGFVSTDDTVFEITEVKSFASSPNSPLSGEALGYEFRAQGQVIGAVEVINGGRVWLDERLPEDQRLVLAGVASALLLRSRLDDPS